MFLHQARKKEKRKRKEEKRKNGKTEKRKREKEKYKKKLTRKMNVTTLGVVVSAVYCEAGGCLFESWFTRFFFCFAIAGSKTGQAQKRDARRGGYAPDCGNN